MATGDTAKMIVELDWKDGKFTAGIVSASKHVDGLGAKLKLADSSIGAMGGTMAKGLSTLGGNLKKLGVMAATSIGAVGIFSVAGAFEQAITKARDFGETVDKTMSLTGLGAEKASALSGALAYVGVDGEAAIKMLGMAEKNLGLLTIGNVKGASSTDGLTKAQEGLRVAQLRLHELQGKGKTSASSLLAAQYKVADAERALTAAKVAGAGATSKAADFQKTYGMSLLDANGKTIDANELLLRSADLYTNKSIPASTKALALSKIYGKAWQSNIEIFEMGRQKIAAAETEMAAAGLTMTPENLAGWEKFRDASRSATGALSGLELQLGLLVMPDLADGMKAFADYARGHQAEIKQFFSNGLKAAKDLAGFITGTVVPVLSTIAGTATKIWGSIPTPMQQLLAGGFVLNKLTGGAVSTLVGQLGSGLIKGVLGMNAGVVNINAAVANGGGGIPGAAGAGGSAAGGILSMLKTGLSVGIAGASIAALGYEIGQFMNGVGASQGAVQGQVDAAKTQGTGATIANLNATVGNLRGMDPFSEMIAQTGAGGQITQDFIDAAKRLTTATLTSAEATAALPSLQGALAYAERAHFDSAIAPLQAAIDRINAAGGRDIPAAPGWADIATAGGGNIPAHGSADRATAGGGAVTFVATLPRNIAVTLAAMGPGAAGVYERAVAKGSLIGMGRVAATLARNNAAIATAARAQASAAAGVKSAAVASAVALRNLKLPTPRVQVTVGGVTVNTNVSVRDTFTKSTTYQRYAGKIDKLQSLA